MNRILDDLSRAAGWRAPARLALAHLFPPAAYMRRTYAPSSGAPLPWLYARRVARGFRKWMES
jgi:hypothetical protein